MTRANEMHMEGEDPGSKPYIFTVSSIIWSANTGRLPHPSCEGHIQMLRGQSWGTVNEVVGVQGLQPSAL